MNTQIHYIAIEIQNSLYETEVFEILTLCVVVRIAFHEDASVARSVVTTFFPFIRQLNVLYQLRPVHSEFQPMVSAERYGHEDQGHRPQNGGDDNKSRGACAHGGRCKDKKFCEIKYQNSIKITRNYAFFWVICYP